MPSSDNIALGNVPDALSQATGDAFKSSRLNLMLSQLTASYKLYWLRGIFDEATAGVTVIPMRRIAARMVALAWYPVTYFRLNLGATDQLEHAVRRAHEVCDLRDDATEEQILEAVLTSSDRGLAQRLDKLCRYVPQRLIRTFYVERLNAERIRVGLGSQKFEARVDRLIVEYNGQDSAGAPYCFVDQGTAIEVDPEWAVYFADNRQVIEDWLDMQLVGARKPL
ncbi:MAG: hypothetical protein Q4B54_13530 [Coriobacteriales bacterium]|nr:hypothetical protein [Coriobacteriales bacterium]